MPNHLKEFIFKNPPKSITYIEGEPLKLTEKFNFFHNKTKLRKNLTPLQLLFKSYMKNPLLASGIRDSYLTEEYTEKFLFVLFTTTEIIKNSNEILASYSDIEFTQGNFFLITTPDYMMLLAEDMNGINPGVEIMKEILNQVLEDYFNKKKFEDYIKIRQFKLSNF
ncbi:unnamed protein product [marine sediment metagenome]|uniref:Uncharacterized protein n=1 Tax=marine sediment metagenome TaxID=412755 RepID=X0TZN2_9ZZZZ